MRSAEGDLPGAAPSDPDHIVLQQVLRRFGILDDLVGAEQVGRAWSNRVWSVRTSGGRYAVKEMLNPWNDPQWREWLEEAIAFEHLAVGAGIAAPRPVVTRTGAALADIDDRTFRVHEWIDDAAPCREGPVSVRVARALAHDLATMHALSVVPSRTDVFPTPTPATCSGWPTLVSDLDRAGSPFVDAAEAAAPEIAAVAAWFAQRSVTTERKVMSHGDVDQKNLLLARGRPWLVDWDVAAPWFPGEEALRTALSLAAWQDPAVAQAFLAAYVAAGGATADPAPESVSVDLIIGVDWLDRCLRIAAGLQDVEAARADEARAHVPTLFQRLRTQVEVAADLPRWLSGSSD